MALPNSTFGLPPEAVKVGVYNGGDVHYDPVGKKYWQLIGASGARVAEDQNLLRSKFPEPFTPVKQTITLKPTVFAGSSPGAGLRYPGEIDSDTDYVSFEFFDYNPPFGRGEGGGFDSITAQGAFDLYQTSGSKEKANKAKDLSSVILYMPEDIQAQYGARWGGADFSTAAVGLSRLTGTEINAGATLQALPGMTKSKIFDTILKGINDITGSSIGLDQFMGSVSGTILNPNTEMLYEGSQLRTFSLSFKMTPKKDAEAKNIKAICNTFKKAMLPSFGGQSLGGSVPSSALITVPKLCQVTFMRGGKIHEYLPAYKLCAIAGVDVNYTPDGAYATYKGGSPVSTRLTISFKETKLLFSEDVDLNGYSY